MKLWHAFWLLIGILLLVQPMKAHSRDNGQYAQVDPEFSKWVRSLTDKKGRGCCATADGYKPQGYEWDIQGNHFRVLIGDTWYDVPDDAVVEQPNKFGYAMVWYYYDNGKLVIRCFLPGTGA